VHVVEEPVEDRGGEDFVDGYWGVGYDLLKVLPWTSLFLDAFEVGHSCF
jgi:hypothetical protein